jgi:hypothetical protein
MEVLPEIAGAELHDEEKIRSRYDDVVQSNDVGVSQCAEHGCFTQNCDGNPLVCIMINAFVFFCSLDCDTLVGAIIKCSIDPSS